MKKDKEKKVLTADEKWRRIRLRKVLKGIIIVLGFTTILLGIHSLVTKTTPILALFCLIIQLAVSKYRESLDPQLDPKKKD